MDEIRSRNGARPTAAADHPADTGATSYRFAFRPLWILSHLLVVFLVILFVNLGFWQLRRLDERKDFNAQVEANASAEPVPLPADLTEDGVDELATVMMPNMAAVRESTLTATVHLHATDRTGEWLMSFEDGLLVTTRDHGKGDLAVRGPAAGLFLWAWNRRSPAEANLEVFGDQALLDAWAALVP